MIYSVFGIKKKKRRAFLICSRWFPDTWRFIRLSVFVSLKDGPWSVLLLSFPMPLYWSDILIGYQWFWHTWAKQQYPCNISARKSVREVKCVLTQHSICSLKGPHKWLVCPDKALQVQVYLLQVSQSVYCRCNAATVTVMASIVCTTCIETHINWNRAAPVMESYYIRTTHTPQTFPSIWSR